jgi:beta-N-acetylhexosaminidase
MRVIGERKTVVCAFFFIFFFFPLYFFYPVAIPNKSLFAQENIPDKSSEEKSLLGTILNGRTYTLDDFYTEDEQLEEVIDVIMGMLTDREKISQMVITYFNKESRNTSEVVFDLILNRMTGGVIIFESSANEIIRLTEEFSDAARNSSSVLLPLYAYDGEPSFIRERFAIIGDIPSPIGIKTEDESSSVAETIALILKTLGIHVNYAPVCDISLNRDIIGSRSFGSDVERVMMLSHAFIWSTQITGIVATAKHFPGHGSVSGDTHKELIFIEGVPPELSIFKHVIDNGVISVMVGHIGIRNHEKYDTGGRPASLSRKIVTGLLKDEMGFQGIVVTDSMKMDAVRSFRMASYEAVLAGCDMILMPRNERIFIQTVQREIQEDDEFRKQIMNSVRKIIRLKVCLGLINGMPAMNHKG